VDSRPERGLQAAPGVRLVFAYDAGGIRLVARQPGPRPSLPSDDPGGEPPETAIAADLHTPQGVPTFRRVVRDAIPDSVEVFHPDRTFRVPEPRASGAFAVLLPDDGRASEVVLVAGARGVPGSFRFAPPPGARAGAREIARFPLREETHGDR